MQPSPQSDKRNLQKLSKVLQSSGCSFICWKLNVFPWEFEWQAHFGFSRKSILFACYMLILRNYQFVHTARDLLKAWINGWRGCCEGRVESIIRTYLWNCEFSWSGRLYICQEKGREIQKPLALAIMPTLYIHQLVKSLLFVYFKPKKGTPFGRSLPV